MLMLLCVHVTRVLFLVLVGNFALDYGLLLELHTLTLVASSYVLLVQVISCWFLEHQQPLRLEVIYYKQQQVFMNIDIFAEKVEYIHGQNRDPTRI